MNKIEKGKPADYQDFIIFRRLEILKQFSGFFNPKLHLIDIGCGNGATLLNVFDQFSSCYGIDIEKERVQLFQNKLNENKINNCTASVSDINEQITHKNYYDRAISFEVLEHVENQNRALRNIYSCLKPGAQFAISVPNKWWIFETHGAHLPLLSWNRVPFFSWLPSFIHSRYAKARIYTKSKIKKTLIDNGFNIISCHYVMAPMDVVSINWLQYFLRKTIFKNHSTSIPFMATSIMVFAEKPT